MISIAMNTPFYRPVEKQGGQLNYFISEEGLGQWELLWCIANPTNDELLGFQEGKIECRLAVVETISFFCFRVWNDEEIVIPWQEIPFNGNLIPGGRSHFEFIKVTLEIEPKIRIGIPIIVVDFMDFIVKYMRYSSLSVEFSRKFVDAILKCQINNQETYNETLHKIYSKFPVGEIAENLTICQCNLGD